MTSYNNILEQANKIVNLRTEEANRQYGAFNESMDKTAQLASLMCNKEITTIDCFQVLNALKLARQSHAHKEDNLLDLVAYVGAMNNYINEKPIVKKIDKCNMFKVFTDIKNKGELVIVRGLKTKEILNYQLVLQPYQRFFNFEGRKMSIKYIKREMAWYLRGDRFDTSITKHASIWKTLVNDDGSINSNYGQYIIPNFKRCANTLIDDVFSRRAIIMIGNNDNFNSTTKDYCCTLSMTFCIRKNKLNMTVKMRSNDAVFGLANDVATFSFFHEMMYVYLRDSKYNDLKLGTYTHQADSMHVYERHFKMLDNILENASYTKVKCPKISSKEEVEYMMDINNPKYQDDEFNSDDFDFTNWLYDDRD